MGKIAIVTDSNSGITQDAGRALGVHILPMPFYINEVMYLEGVTLSQEEFYQFLQKDEPISTSQPNPGEVCGLWDSLLEEYDEILHIPMVTLSQEEFYQFLQKDEPISTSQPNPGEVCGLWDSLLEEYDEILHIPMSSGLSASCETAMALARDYEGKVQVVDNQRISVTQRQSVLDALALIKAGKNAAQIRETAMALARDYEGKVQVVDNQRISVTQRQSVLDALALIKAGKNAAQIREILEAEKLESSIYITLETLKYLKKGGRITPAAAAIGSVLNLKPVLQIQWNPAFILLWKH